MRYMEINSLKKQKILDDQEGRLAILDEYVHQLNVSVVRMQEQLENMSTTAETLLKAYPVGSIYISIKPTNPSELFGGEWAPMKDRFLLGVGDIYKVVNDIGGEATHKLTVNEIPYHTHQVTRRYKYDNRCRI